jgi:putative tricarboxylic transport membrane protein
MFEAITAALGMLGHFDAIILIFIGAFIGLVFGIMPGVGGVTALVLVVPITFGWQPANAMFFLTGIMGAVGFGGAVPAILINTPGTAMAAASCFDGYPMAQRGEAGRALGISASSSFFGGLFGLVLLVLLIPVTRRIVLMLGPPDFFLTVLWGLSAVAVAAQGNMVKGLFAGGIGLCISLVGFSPVFGVMRYNFGTQYLYEGIPMSAFLLGIFAISEVFHMLTSRGAIAKDQIEGTMKGVIGGIIEVFEHKMTFFVSSIIGVIVGIIPGVGGAVANFLSYVAGMQYSKHPETFGKGNPEGLIASETANDSKDGGALLPTVAFGIPGSAEMVILLGAFVIHGIEPGPGMLINHLDVVFVLILGLLVSKLMANTLGLMASCYLIRVTKVNVKYLMPFIVIISFVGCFAYRGNLWDIIPLLIFGVVGFGARRFGFPRVCLVIGYILGDIAETMYTQSLMISYGSYSTFVDTPLRVVLIVLVILTLAVPFLGGMKRKITRG